jgi:hypothetical protein
MADDTPKQDDAPDPKITSDPKTLDATMVPIVAETKIIVQRTVKLDGVDSDSASSEDVIAITIFATTPAMAHVSVPIKLSRSFQSVGVEVGVYLPCYKEELPEAIELAYRLAKERVAREIPIIKKALEDVSV